MMGVRVGTPWRTAGAVLLGVIMVLGAQAALGVSTRNANKGAKKLVVQDAIVLTSDANNSTIQDLASGATLNVPAGQTGMIVARFSANSVCNSGAAGTICIVKVYVDGSLVRDVFFDADDTGDNYLEAHAFQHVTDVLNPGPHTIELKVNTNASGTTLQINQGVLTAELWRVT